MSARSVAVLRFCLGLVKTILQAGLIVWAACAPLVWIVRDGLGPDSRESGGAWAVFKFVVQWGIPALVLAVPILAAACRLVDRRLSRHVDG